MMVYIVVIEAGVLSLISYPENIAPDSEGVEPKTMTIGINNVFEVGCSILLY